MGFNSGFKGLILSHVDVLAHKISGIEFELKYFSRTKQCRSWTKDPWWLL